MAGLRTLLADVRGRLNRAQGLGDLERRVMDVVWDQQTEVSVREVQATLGQPLAYTTLMTTLDRLFKKGFLDRRKAGRAFVYGSRISRAQLEQGLASGVIAGLLGRGASQPILSCIVDTVGEHDQALLDELARLVQEKRQRARMRGGR